MDKNTDFHRYNHRSRQYLPNEASLHKKRVIHTRILKLSAPKSQNPYEAWGNCLFDLKQYEKSIFPLQQASKRSLQNWQLVLKLSKAFSILEKYDQSLASLQKIFSIRPNFDDAHDLLIKLFEEQIKLEQLDSFYQKTESMLSSPSYIPEFYFRAAQALGRADKYGLSLRYYKKANEINPDENSYRYQYGLALYHERQFEQAIVEFEHALRLRASSKHSYNNIVFLTYLAGRVERAIEGLEYILANDLEISATYANIVIMLYHLREDDEEIEPYKEKLQQCIRIDSEILESIFTEELELTKKQLESSDIEEEVKRFNMQKVKSLNFTLDLMNKMKQ